LVIYDKEPNHSINEFKIFNQQQTAALGNVRFGRTFNLLLIPWSLFYKIPDKIFSVRAHVYNVIESPDLSHLSWHTYWIFVTAKYGFVEPRHSQPQLLISFSPQCPGYKHLTFQY